MKIVVLIDRCIFFVKIQLKVEFFTYIKENTTFFFLDMEIVFSLANEKKLINIPTSTDLHKSLYKMYTYASMV